MKALICWSGGKDGLLACEAVRRRNDVEIAGLLTTLNQSFDRVAMHAVRRDLLEAQARSIGIPLWPVPLPWPCSNEEYERIMEGVCKQAVAAGIEVVVFGDLYLEDVRAYRERQLRGTGLEPLFPLWKLPTAALASKMIENGLRAKITCVDPKVLSAAFAGREFDQALLAQLPAGIDPCGEKGEFHSFVYDGPMFRDPVRVQVGSIVERDGFVFADVSEEAQSGGE